MKEECSWTCLGSWSYGLVLAEFSWITRHPLFSLWWSLSEDWASVALWLPAASWSHPSCGTPCCSGFLAEGLVCRGSYLLSVWPKTSHLALLNLSLRLKSPWDKLGESDILHLLNLHSSGGGQCWIGLDMYMDIILKLAFCHPGPGPSPYFVSVTQRMKLILEGLAENVCSCWETWTREILFSPMTVSLFRLNTLNGIGIHLLYYLVAGYMPSVGTKRNTREYFMPEDLEPVRNVFSCPPCTGSRLVEFYFPLLFPSCVKCWYGDFL